MRIRFNGFPHTGNYQGPTGLWNAGDVREVDDEDAAVLLADFAGYFVPVEPTEPSTTGPPRHTAGIGAPRRR